MVLFSNWSFSFLHAVIRYLIAQNVPVERVKEDGSSPAMNAVGRCAECLEELLSKNTRVSEVRFREGCHGLNRYDRCRDNFTLLHFAAQLDDLRAMDILSYHNVDSGLDFRHVKLT